MFNRNQSHIKYIVSGYLLCILLVLVYVNMFSVWSIISRSWNSDFLQVLPIIITIVILVVISLLFYYRKHSNLQPVRALPVVAGIFLCLAALTVPDPQIPIKRIHVVEYLLLALVVRHTMSFRLQGLPLLFFSMCFTAILGIHDEFLQGLHPSRTYGIRDIMVNTLGGCGGALIWHGFGLFVRTTPAIDHKSSISPFTALSYIAWLFLSIVAFIYPLYYYRGNIPPSWPAFPLAAAMVFVVLQHHYFPTHWKHGMLAISSGAFLLVLYPAAIRTAEFIFF